MLFLRLGRWTSGDAPGASTGLPIGPLRFRAWTSRDGAAAATTGLPFGPLRFRAWTSGPIVLNPAVTGLHLGALRFRAWTPGPEIEEPPAEPPAAVEWYDAPQGRRRQTIARDDEELMQLVAMVLYTKK